MSFNEVVIEGNILFKKKSWLQNKLLAAVCQAAEVLVCPSLGSRSQGPSQLWCLVTVENALLDAERGLRAVEGRRGVTRSGLSGPCVPGWGVHAVSWRRRPLPSPRGTPWTLCRMCPLRPGQAVGGERGEQADCRRFRASCPVSRMRGRVSFLFKLLWFQIPSK